MSGPSGRRLAYPPRARLRRFICLAAFAALAGYVHGEIGAPSIRFVGNQTFTAEELAKRIPLDEGIEPDESWLDAAQRTVLGLYETNGYLEAKVQVDFAPGPEGGDVVVTIEEGPRYNFGATRVEESDYPPRVIYRELTYKQGEPFNRAEVFRTQAKLHRLNLFKELRIYTSTEPVHLVVVHVTGKRGTTQKIRGGVGYGSEDRLRLSVGYQNLNFLRRAYRLDLDSTFSHLRIEEKAELIDRYLFGTETEGRLQGRWMHERRDGYQFESLLGKVSLGRDLWWRVNGSLAYRREVTVTFNVDPGIAEAGLAPNTDISSIQPALSRDTTRDPFFPNSGSRINFSYEHAGGALRGTEDFDKFFLRGTRYLSLWSPRFVFACQGHGGVAWTYGKKEREIPITERFFTGGANSVRGYRERGVGPQISGEPVGGTHELGASMEFRFPIVWKFNGAAFVDGGMVAEQYQDIEPTDWKFGAGAGIRFMTPVGPVRLDYGYKLNRDVGDVDLWRIHFSLGEAF